MDKPKYTACSPRNNALILFVIPLLLFSLLMTGCASIGSNNAADGHGDRVPVIFDTDMATDVDDVGALATLHALEDRGEAKILAVGTSERNKWQPLCVDAINTYYGHDDIPMGRAPSSAVRFGSKYTKQIANEFPRSRNWNISVEAPLAVDVYRRVLSEQPDDSVVIVTVGFLTNLAHLLESKPDEYSDLDGKELVEKKVRLWVAMGGKIPEGGETNIKVDPKASRHVTKNWPTEVVFSPLRIGGSIRTGAGLAELPKDNPIRRAYKLHKGEFKDHSSFDQSAVLYAVRALDDGPAADYWTLSDPGRMKVLEDGNNVWKSDPDGNHRYLIEKRDPEKIAREIENLMKYTPK